MNYENFVSGKLRTLVASGLSRIPAMPPYLFGHQAALTSWALKRGRCAIFADTGLGKTRMELVYSDAVSRHTARPVLILAPLAVAAQTALEVER